MLQLGLTTWWISPEFSFSLPVDSFLALHMINKLSLLVFGKIHLASMVTVRHTKSSEVCQDVPVGKSSWQEFATPQLSITNMDNTPMSPHTTPSVSLCIALRVAKSFNIWKVFMFIAGFNPNDRLPRRDMDQTVKKCTPAYGAPYSVASKEVSSDLPI